MCRTTTPASKQIRCGRCKTGIVNPDDNWVHGMRAGRITLSMHSRIYDYMLSGHGFDPTANNEDTVLSSKAVKDLYAQKVDLEFGFRPGFVVSGSMTGPTGKYPLCEECHKLLLRIIGEFFFADPERLNGLAQQLSEVPA